MQNAIAAGAVSSAANPLLDLWIQHVMSEADGSLVHDPTELSFQIFDVSSEAKLLAPLQVFPASVGTRQTVNLTTARIAGDPGHFAAAWTATVSTPATYGRYEIRWFYKTVLGGPELQVRRTFDVLQAGVPIYGASGYCSVSDLRDEGFPSSVASDARVLLSIRLASAMIDRACGQFFEPRLATIRASGYKGRALQLDVPIIALLDVTIGQPAGDPLDPSGFRVFNRHILAGPSAPDDRQNPMIEFRTNIAERGGGWLNASEWANFPRGVQNVNVRGLFGYTDFDGSATGETPLLIRHACKLLTVRELAKMSDAGREDRERYRLTSERVRDQSYTLSEAPQGPFTGDQEIDNILISYARPPRIASV